MLVGLYGTTRSTAAVPEAAAVVISLLVYRSETFVSPSSSHCALATPGYRQVLPTTNARRASATLMLEHKHTRLVCGERKKKTRRSRKRGIHIIIIVVYFTRRRRTN